jgi:DNA-binding transcriptional ArsR family regulator
MRKDHRIVADSPRDDEIDIKLVRALAHPLRLKILQVLGERDASPNQLKELLDYPLGNVAYHARVLEKAGCVRQVRTARRRGAVEHFFRATPRSYIGHPEWKKVPLSVRGAFTEAAVQTFVNRLAAAMEEGTIDHEDLTSLTWVTLSLDTMGRVEVAAILRDAFDRVQAVHELSEERMPGTGEEPTPVVVGLASFQVAGSRQPQPGTDQPHD